MRMSPSRGRVDSGFAVPIGGPRSGTGLGLSLLLGLLVALAPPASASAAEVVHVCNATVSDGYGRPVSGARVQFTLMRPDNNTVPLTGPKQDVTGPDGKAAIWITFDKGTAADLHCKVLPDGLPHKIKTYENVVSFRPPAPIGQVVDVTAEMAPAWESSSDARPIFAGANIGQGHGYGWAQLYLPDHGTYDKVVIIAQGMDFFERSADRATDDDVWFAFGDALKALYARGYAVWLFRPYLTGENVHEQAAEFAQAIQYAANYRGSARGGKVIVAGYSLGAMVARIATARWEADPEWRTALGLDVELPAHRVAFLDGALRGGNVNLKLQMELLGSTTGPSTNLPSCAALQLLRTSPLCNGDDCFNSLFRTGSGFSFNYAHDGTCDEHQGSVCKCDAGPAVSSLNGDGFPHGMEVFAFSAGTWQPPFNMCYGGERDRSASGQDMCPSDPGGDGSYAPSPGDVWWSVRCLDAFGSVLDSRPFYANADDLAPGSRFTLAFQNDPLILKALPGLAPWVCAELQSVQNFAFTFIPIDSSLAADSEAEIPFAPGHWKAATYQAVHNRPPQELVGWLFDEFDKAYGEGPGGGGGGSAPAAPGNLKAEPVIGGWDQIDLTWEDRSNNEDRFEIQRMRSNAPPGEDGWKTVYNVPANQTSFHDDGSTGLRVPTRAEGTLFYFYRVKAVNDYGSGESNRADANLYEQPPDPSNALRPRGCVDQLLPELSWNGGNRSTKYYVRLIDESTGDEAFPPLEVHDGHTRVSRPLEPQRPYMLRVWGENNVGWGTGSNPEFFRTLCTPVDPPEWLEPVGCIGTLTPVLRWTEVPGTTIDDGYHLVVQEVTDLSNDPPSIINLDPSTPSYQVPPGLLSPGKDYRVKVRPNTGSNADPYSRIRFFTPMCGQATGAGFTSPISPGEAVTTRPEFVFEPASRADSYRLELFNETGSQLLLAQDYAAGAICSNGLCNARLDAPLSPGRYAWRVRAGRGIAFDPYAVWGWVHIPTLPVVSVGPASGSEAVGRVTFTLALSAASTSDVTVALRTEDGTALHDQDFGALAGTWTIPAGATTLPVTVPLVVDAVPEEAETFRLHLLTVHGALLGSDVGIGTIAEDEPLPQLVMGDAANPESGPVIGGPWTVPVHLLGRSEHEVTATVTFGACTAEAGSDFAPSSEVVTFAPGETEKLVQLTVLDDAIPEGHEVVAASLSSTQGATIAESTGQVTIINDDRAGTRKRRKTRSDFDGDGNNDIVWQDPGTHALWLWRMVGVNRVATVPFNLPAWDGNWTLVGAADFNADGKPDLLWRNDDSGQLAFALMDGMTFVSAQLIDGEPDRAWKVVATGNFNADASPDLLWRDDTTGNLKVWFMEGTTHQGEAALTPSHAASDGWYVRGVGDFDGDGKDDLLWRNPTVGRSVVWLMDGVVRREARVLDPDDMVDWQVAAVMDVDADGTTDIVWQRSNPDRLMAWLMTGTTLKCPVFLTPRTPDIPGRRIVGPR